jgi:LPXTG-motif cell wall-anchored protein
VIFTPLVEREEEIKIDDGSFAYKATNSPLPYYNTTSITVNKKWELGKNPNQDYDTYQIPVKLYANGIYTGRTEILSLQNGWKVSFESLPFRDENGNAFVYTVEEVFTVDGWGIILGDMNYVQGTPGSYTTTITNRNLVGHGIILPSTGGAGTIIYILCGLVLILAPFVYGFRMRRRHERRSK